MSVSEPPRQLPLDLGHAAGRSRDDLVVSPANQLAVGLIDGWPQWPAPVVVLAGPAGSGKTHLGAVWVEAAGAAGLSAARLGAEAIAVAGAGPVFIDDADRPGRDESGLFHVINTARAAGHALLITGRGPAAGWGVALPDLASRLKAAATVTIGAPDDLLLAGVITKLFADRQVEVDPQLVDFLVRRMERSLSAAITVVAALDLAALQAKSRISRALALSVLQALETSRAGLADPDGTAG